VEVKDGRESSSNRTLFFWGRDFGSEDQKKTRASEKTAGNAHTVTSRVGKRGGVLGGFGWGGKGVGVFKGVFLAPEDGGGIHGGNEGLEWSWGKSSCNVRPGKQTTGHRIGVNGSWEGSPVVEQRLACAGIHRSGGTH